MNLNDTSTRFLETYAAGGEPEGGWLYAKALKQAALDFSPESLVRLDALLTQIRERAKPTRADLDTERGRNFEALLVFYLVELARRISHAHFTWLDAASAREALPHGAVPDESPETRLIVDAPAHALLFRPLAWLEAQILPDGELRSVGDYLASLLAQLKRDGPALWSSAMFAVGRLGSWHMMMAADDRGMWPTRITARSPTELRFIERTDLQRVVDWGHHQLNDNPDNEVWQVFSYPGYAEHGGERVDAVIVLAATYGEQPMRLSVAFPFVPARDGQRLVILQPALVDATLAVEAAGKLGGALERGIRSVQWSVGGGWNELYRA